MNPTTSNPTTATPPNVEEATNANPTGTSPTGTSPTGTSPTGTSPSHAASDAPTADGATSAESASAEGTAGRPTRPATDGFVAFIGAGPGDPGMLTLRAAELLRIADLVIYDAGTRDIVLHHCAPTAETVEVAPPEAEGAPGITASSSAPAADGDAPEEPPLPTAEAALGSAVAAAQTGRVAVRVLAGDPGLNGGLLAETAVCTQAKVVFEVVPGVAVETAVPAYAGVPLSRNHDTRVRIVRLGEGTADPAAGDAETLVLLGTVPEVRDAAAALVGSGRDGGTPLTVTLRGSTTAQTTVAATLDGLAAALKTARIDSGAAVAVVGEAVSHRDEMSWFETKPLFGWKVLVPRTKEQAASLSVQLREYGAVPHEVPTIAVEPPRTPQQMERAVKGLVTGRYEWIAFTSVNAVKAVREKFEEYGLDARAFAGIKVAAVGEQTAASLRAFGVKPDLVPSGEQSAAGLLEDWPPYDPVFDPIERVFLPRADIATETLVAGLIELGWEVDDVTAYRTVRAAPPPAPTREAIKSGGFDAVLFTSSSTVRNLVGIAGKPHHTTIIACIGPATAKTAEEHGLRVDVLSTEPSVSALARALADFGAARRATAIAAGEPVLRPSERRAGGRRRAR